MHHLFYQLEEKTAVPSNGLYAVKERVDRTVIAAPLWRRLFRINPESIIISTMFLGMDHSWGHGDKQLFETMIFGGPRDQEQVRYATWEEAQKGHNEIVSSLCSKGGRG